MTTNAPTLINLPPPPSGEETPGDAPGTPNSVTTTMSELSTVAIKDGHRGHFPHHRNPAEAERADRISRLAGLERVAVSGHRMSEDQDMDTSSIGGFSDEAASLVGFGEGARTPARQHSQLGSPAVSKASAVPGYLRDGAPASPLMGVSVPSTSSTQTMSSTEQQKKEARMMNGMTYDENVVDTTSRAPPASGRDGDSTSGDAIRERMAQRQADQDAMDVEQRKQA
ncbi:hypothetical protein Ptr902_10203 [Pyrenophora tritici-repentis]|nr:hypothetical protein Alg215_04695 [Pyrenophora tritici-repentis]KAI0590110.1 hypothetical protein Alg130_02579 [Pyrenophora tritici-repentis]KAI0613259.1 hypothetical protein TUN205_02480 [Pyrenophora tritici-repentis]KAI0625238.1 hypothetical protein TUN199_02748 [Pyrenophora tritici-repentis]KAI2478590.1 hypothetical protein Ptr902_10203 [Pyrenophora tritici-repentis]